MLLALAQGTKHEPFPAASEYIQLSACDGFELFPWQPHSNLCGGTRRPTEESSIEQFSMALVYYPSLMALGIEQKPLPDASEQSPSYFCILPQGWNRSLRPLRSNR